MTVDVEEESPKNGETTASAIPTSGAWSWDVRLAAQRLAYAEEEFRALVRDNGGGSGASLSTVANAAAANKHNDAKKEYHDSETFEEGVTWSASLSTVANAAAANKHYDAKEEHHDSETFEEDGTWNEGHNTYSPIAPHKRPRHIRRDYRFSPLEPLHDEKLIPPTKIQDVAAAIPAAVERERLFEQHPGPLLIGKRLWCYDNLDYAAEHPMANYGGGAFDVTPDDWPEDGVGDDDREVQSGSKPWPRGAPFDASVFTLCWRYFLFTYGKGKTASNKVIFWAIIASFVSPACSYLFGTGLIDELNERTSRGETEQDRLLRSSLYALAIFLLRTFGAYLTTQPMHCGYSINGAPTGAARAALRDTLFHRMRHLKSSMKDKITPGAASGIIVDKVFETVNIYYAFLTAPALVSGILAEFAVSFTSLRNIHVEAEVILPMVAVIVLSLLVPLLINMWYQPELCVLMRLEHQWRLRLRAMAGCAVPVHSKHFVANDSTSSNPIEDEKEEECFRKIFHQTVYLENMRHFHSWKMTVVVSFLIELCTQTGIAIVTIIGGYAVITGRGVTVGNFATLISSVSGLIQLGSAMGTFFINLYENHTMLKIISCIMNDEDVGFDGGVDSFGTIHHGILEKEKQVASKFKNALHATHHHKQIDPNL